MKKEQKKVIIEELNKKFSQANTAVLAHYRGLNCDQIYNLRRQLKSASAELKVGKNTYFKIASKGTQFEGMSNYCEGPVAITFINGDPAEAAKALIKYSKEVKEFELKVGMLQGKLMDVKMLEELSKLPSRQVLLTQLLSVMVAPMSGFVNVLAGVPRGFVTTLNALKEKKQETAH